MYMRAPPTLLSHFGLRRPYNFARAIPFITGSTALVAVGITAAALIITGKIYVGSNLFAFCLYILALLLFALVLIPYQRMSMALIILAYAEVFLGVSTHLANYAGLPIPSLLPNNEPALNSKSRFKFHPLLMAVPRENFRSSGGIDIRHNSKNMRGEEIAIGPGQSLINIYGGSTTYDIGVPTSKTWGEKLQQLLGNGWVVANFGVPGYSSAENPIQTAFYSDAVGVQPLCSVYYLGWNDIRNAHLPNLDSAYADYHLLSQLSNLQLRGSRTSFSPAYRLVFSVFAPALDSIPYPADYHRLGTVSGSDPRLESIFANNIRTIHAVNASKGIKTVFIGQILNPARLNSDAVYGWLPRVRDKDVWPLQETFNAILKQEAVRLGAGIIAPDVREFENADFVDNGHFSVSGSEKFAKLIAPDVATMCK